LFLQSLGHYIDKNFQEVAAVAFQSDSPLENIKAAVKKICDIASNEKGCLMINSMVELAPHDPEVKVLIKQAAGKRLRVMTEMITRAQQLGEIRPELDSSKLALQLMVTLAGAAATSKGVIEPADIGGIFEGMIDSWT
jgi:TetR/AcrR family transcriptional repressor of nem operon